MRTWEELYEEYGLWDDTLDLEDELQLAAFVYSPETMVCHYDLSFIDCVELKKSAEAQKYGREILLSAIWALTHGRPVGKGVRQLVFTWASSVLGGAASVLFELAEDEQKSGRPEVSEKIFAVCTAYERKRNADPQRKPESIVSELEQEFGLKRRRIFQMLAFREAFGFEGDGADI